MAFFNAFYDEQTKIWSGPKQEKFYHPDCSIGSVIFQNLNNYPNNVLQISDIEGTTMTNSEALTAAKRIAQHLKKMGLGCDDVIGIVALNTTYVMPLAVACLFNCTPFHGVNPVYDEKNLSYIFGLTKPKLIFCDGQFYDKIRLATQSFQPIIYTLFEHLESVPKVLDLLESTETELMYRPQPLTLGGQQTMAILCSSGTTGLPKAICITNSRMHFNADFVTSEVVVFSASGIDWLSGLWLVTVNAVKGCTRIITNKSFAAEYFVEIVRKYNVNMVVLPPRHIVPLLTCPTATVENLTSLRYFALGGGGMALATLKTLKSIAKNALVNFFFATTEVGVIAMNFEMNKLTSVGKLMPGMRARVVDESGKNLGPTEIGEIYVDHGHPWIGYYNNPKETQAARDSDGWFHTGDLGYFDAEHFLYIVDRIKDILKYNGFQFWPSEIEGCIMEIPQVQEVCVVGIYDESCGDKAGALVARSRGSTVSEREIEDYVAKKLVLEHKQLHAGVIFVERLPHNLNGKTEKNKAKELFVAALKKRYI